jgi:uncharacterized membrane protein YcaP (DUF421 family)
MPTFLEITLRAVLTYLVLLLFSRLMGKREISQMTFFDYVTGITIGSIGAQLSTDRGSAWLELLPAVIVFSLFQISLSFLSKKSPRFRRIVIGSPAVLIEKGKILEKNMAKERITLSELIEKLREKNAFNLADVETAILEVDGQISVQLKANKRTVTPLDLNIQPPSQGLPKLIIEDGNLLEESLKDVKLTKSWLLTKLAEQDIHDISKVMLAQVDTLGNLYVDLYADMPTKN